MHLHLISPNNGSIGEISQDLLPFLKEQYTVTEEFAAEGPGIPKSTDILLMHYVKKAYVIAPAFNLFNKTILIQPIDGTVIKTEYVGYMNEFDLIITPGNAGKVIMQRNGVKTPIKVIPNYVDSRVLTDRGSDVFTFYTEATNTKRKNLDLLIKAFGIVKEQFNVRLVIRSDFGWKKNLVMKLHPGIKLVSKWQDDPSRLWAEADAYVNTSGIEGFSIPMLRFSTQGKPVIALKNMYSGYYDFVDSKYLVDCRWEDFPAHNIYETSRFAFAEPHEVAREMIKAIGQKPKFNPKFYEDYHIDTIANNYIKAIND